MTQYEELLATRHAVEAERCRYQELFDFAPYGYLVTDAAGTIREVNHAAATLLGVSQTRLAGKPLVAFVDAAERPAFRSRLVELAQISRLDDWEIHLRPRRGVPFPVALTVASIRNPGGMLVGLRWLLRDITAYKQAEAALRQSEGRYRTLIEGAIQGMLIVEDAVIRFANPAVATIFAMPARTISLTKSSTRCSPRATASVSRKPPRHTGRPHLLCGAANFRGCAEMANLSGSSARCRQSYGKGG